MFSFLNQTASAVPGEPQPETLDSVVAELHAVQTELSDIGRTIQAYRHAHPDLRTTFIGAATMRLNQFRLHPELRRLEGERDRILRKRNDILHRYAHLKIAQHAE